MSASMILWFATVVMAIVALVMGNLWALGMGLIFAVVGNLSEKQLV